MTGNSEFTAYFPKGRHLGDPLEQLWPELFAEDKDFITVHEKGKTGRIIRRRFRPKDLQYGLPNADIFVTSWDRAVDVLSRDNSFDPHDEARVKELLAKKGFIYLVNLQYNPCFLGVLSQSEVAWRRGQDVTVYSEFPYFTYREEQRSSDGEPALVRIGADTRLIGKKNGNGVGTNVHSRVINIVPISGGAENYVLDSKSSSSVAVTVVQKGDTLADNGLQLQELLLFSQPFLGVSEAAYEQIPDAIKRIEDIALRVVEKGKERYSTLFKPPGVVTNPKLLKPGESYNRQVIDFVDGHYPTQSARGALLKTLGLPSEKPLARTVASYR